MIVTLPALNQVLLNNVADIRFVRRRPKAGQPPTRRMLCTKSASLLESTNGRISLNYMPPKGTKQFNESLENALVVWDIFMQDYRIVSCDQVNLINSIPANDEFWNYYNENLLSMTGDQKLLIGEK